MHLRFINVKIDLNYNLILAKYFKLKDKGFVELKNIGLKFLIKLINQDGKLQFSIRKLKINFGKLNINFGKSIPKFLLSKITTGITFLALRILRKTIQKQAKKAMMNFN